MKGNKLRRLVVPISLILALVLVVPMLSGCFPKAAEPAAPAAPAPEPAAPAPEPEPTPPPEEVEPIFIGAPLALSGPPGADAVEIERGMVMALEDINARGGLLGRPVESIVFDTFDWAAENQIAARDYLMGQGAVAFFPGYNLDITHLEIYAAPETGGIPIFDVDTTEAFYDIVAENVDRYWNHIGFDDTTRIYSPLAYVTFNKAIPEVYDYPSKTVAFVTQDLTYNIEISNGFKDLLEADPEWEVVVDEMFPYGALEFGVQLAKIREANPGIIFFSGISLPESVAFVTQFLDDPTDSLLHVQYAPSIAQFREMLGERSIGIMWQSIIVANPTYEMAEFWDRHVEMWGAAPGRCLVWSNYDMVMAWAEAVEAVGDETDYRAISDYIIDTHIKGFTFGPGGTNFCSLARADRTHLPPYVEKCHPELHEAMGIECKVETGIEYGSSAHYYQIQMTSDGPQDIMLFMHGMPTEEYMLEYYGYPPQDQYIIEVGSEFEVPPWIGQ